MNRSAIPLEQQGALSGAMSDANKAVLRRYFQEVWNQGNLALVDELFARDWVGHEPPHEFGGLVELKHFIAAQRQARPTLQITVEDQIEEGDRVATRWTARGTRREADQGSAVTGDSEAWTGITLARLANGKIIEGWTQSQAPTAGAGITS
jgi:predicted ester cyclase